MCGRSPPLRRPAHARLTRHIRLHYHHRRRHLRRRPCATAPEAARSPGPDRPCAPRPPRRRRRRRGVRAPAARSCSRALLFSGPFGPTNAISRCLVIRTLCAARSPATAASAIRCAPPLRWARSEVPSAMGTSPGKLGRRAPEHATITAPHATRSANRWSTRTPARWGPTARSRATASAATSTTTAATSESAGAGSSAA
jgi:hypothetical protein